jgi:uncharacterized membrane protein YhaH (DUF805 family)
VSWLYPVTRNEASTATTRTGRVVYWAFSVIATAIHAAGFLVSALMFFTDADGWWWPVLVAALVGMAVHLMGRGLRYILSDE